MDQRALQPETWRYRVQVTLGNVVHEVRAASLAEALRLRRALLAGGRATA